MRTCRLCGCTDNDCSQCIERTGERCYWLNDKDNLCSACLELNEVVEFVKTRTEVSVNDIAVQFSQIQTWAIDMMSRLQELKIVGPFQGVPNRTVIQ